MLLIINMLQKREKVLLQYSLFWVAIQAESDINSA